jgi:polyphosphate kinase 2 (PPK2 family)
MNLLINSSIDTPIYSFFPFLNIHISIWEFIYSNEYIIEKIMLMIDNKSFMEKIKDINNFELQKITNNIGVINYLENNKEFTKQGIY